MACQLLLIQQQVTLIFAWSHVNVFILCFCFFSIATVMTNLGKLGHNHSTFSWHLKWHILFMVRTKWLKHCRISVLEWSIFFCVLGKSHNESFFFNLVISKFDCMYVLSFQNVVLRDLISVLFYVWLEGVKKFFKSWKRWQ